MGRIGRAYLRYATEHPDIEVVAANDVADVTAIARLLRRDSTLGRFRGEVREEGDVIVVDGRKVAMSAIHDPEDLPWGELDVDVVIECSGAPPAFADSIRVARSGATLVIAALYKNKVELRPDRLVEKELTVRGSFAYRDEFPAVIAELERGGLDAEALVSHSFPLERIQEAFATQADAARSLKVTVSPGG